MQLANRINYKKLIKFKQLCKMLDDFNRGQKLTILVFALVNFCSAICVSLQVNLLKIEVKHFQFILIVGCFIHNYKLNLQITNHRRRFVL